MSARREGLARPAYDLCARVCGVCVGWGEPQLDDDGDDDAMCVLFSATTNIGLVVENMSLRGPPRQRVIKHAPVSRYTRESPANGSPATAGNNSADWNEWALDLRGKGSTLHICNCKIGE